MSSYYKEGFLVQLLFYSIVWLFNEYLGLLLCIIMTTIIGGLLIFAWVAEKIEPSKVPKSYFTWMIASTLAPLIVGLAFATLYKGNFDWLQ